ncbi:hypothetical protein GYMLUDRAFT_567662 [Collybiopsis luxurians FD-317 M1]|uniref:Uncharacterized protein n=1 Tax=Collybiopsis luxurians FD-317 M1 TaxID=944289 RepID=A0A0D0CR41_9AGAR|nr:hypothetical protein GYMLUDRAFT_567662 [Collybiopsis luxurians FD-317 M1]
MYYYPMLNYCYDPFFTPRFSTMAALGFAASICVAVAVDRLLCRRNPPANSANIGWILTRCEDLERQLSEQELRYEELKLVSAASQAKYLKLERYFLANEQQYERRCAELESDNARLRNLIRAQQNTLRLQPFVSFLDRLLLVNKLLRQRKDLVRLKEVLAEKEQDIRSKAFIAFRDRVLVANLVWKQQKQLKLLKEEAETLKRGRVRAVTRSAKQMVLDTRREGMVDELVKGLIEDIERGKRRERELKEKYEQDIEELNGEWVKEHKKLLSEIEELRLSQRAKLIEQEISNQVEDRLVANLAESRREVARLEALKG